MKHPALEIRIINAVLLASAICLLLLQAACTPRTTLGEAPMPSSLPDSEIVLGPGDEIEVKFLLWPELNEVQRIRPDGKISLQLIEDVQAAGLTTGQLKLLLEQRYQGRIKDPDILVLVRELADQEVYVTGNVNLPGPIPLKRRMTALEAVMAAGGFSKPFVETIVIYRTAGNRVVSKALKIGDYHGDTPGGADPFYVQAKDMIQVR